MCKVCVLCAYLKSTILKKKDFLKSMILKKKNFFLKSMIFNEIVFVKNMFLNEFFSSCLFLNQKLFALSDYKLTFLQGVRF